jgi:HlyD family secretion protein
VKSKASGIVEKLFVDINDRVKKGQELAQLDQQEIEAQVDAQRAQLASAEANVTTYEANIEQDKVNAAAPDLPMYKATLDRNLEMQKEGIVSRQALDDANKRLPGGADEARLGQGADRRGHGQAEAGAGAGAAEPGQPEAA